MEAVYNYNVRFADTDGKLHTVQLHAHTKYHAVELAYSRKQHLQPNRSMYSASKVLMAGTRA